MNYKARKRIDAVQSGTTDTLDLSHLDLTELPDEVYTLTNLRVLSVANLLLRSNQEDIETYKRYSFGEEDQAFIKEMEQAEQELQNDLLVPKQLQSLDAKISQLTSLEILDLSYNRFDRLPDSIGSLPNLRRLIVSNNLLTDLPETLAQVMKLELLDIQDNPIQSIPKLPQLEKYELYKEHFRQQRQQAFSGKDIDLGVWLYRKEIEYGLLRWMHCKYWSYWVVIKLVLWLKRWYPFGQSNKLKPMVAKRPHISQGILFQHNRIGSRPIKTRYVAMGYLAGPNDDWDMPPSDRIH